MSKLSAIGFSWDVYSSGPRLARLAELVERVNYEDLDMG